MMTSSSQGHLNSRTGDIDFPLWAKVVAGILGVCTPIGLTTVGWLTIQVVEMRRDMQHLGNDRLTKTEFLLYLDVQAQRDFNQNQRLDQLEEANQT